jgi:ubiquinone/menaquinone biosynthesis C-methylase UbiE
MSEKHRVCPWWLGYLLVTPLRRLVEPPERLLGPFVRPGMTVVEPGCGMGYFTLPLARMVGPGGKVICVDLQEKMIAGLLRRARRAGLADRIVASVPSETDLGLDSFAGSADLALALHMVHEVPDERRFLEQMRDVLRPGGLLLVVEPSGHVSAAMFEQTIRDAEQARFARTDRVVRGRGRGAALRKPA